MWLSLKLVFSKRVPSAHFCSLITKNQHHSGSISRRYWFQTSFKYTIPATRHFTASVHSIKMPYYLRFNPYHRTNISSPQPRVFTRPTLHGLALSTDGIIRYHFLKWNEKKVAHLLRNELNAFFFVLIIRVVYLLPWNATSPFIALKKKTRFILNPSIICLPSFKPFILWEICDRTLLFSSLAASREILLQFFEILSIISF